MGAQKKGTEDEEGDPEIRLETRSQSAAGDSEGGMIKCHAWLRIDLPVQ